MLRQWQCLLINFSIRDCNKRVCFLATSVMNYDYFLVSSVRYRIVRLNSVVFLRCLWRPSCALLRLNLSCVFLFISCFAIDRPRFLSYIRILIFLNYRNRPRKPSAPTIHVLYIYIYVSREVKYYSAKRFSRSNVSTLFVRRE